MVVADGMAVIDVSMMELIVVMLVTGLSTSVVEVDIVRVRVTVELGVERPKSLVQKPSRLADSMMEVAAETWSMLVDIEGNAVEAGGFSVYVDALVESVEVGGSPLTETEEA